MRSALALACKIALAHCGSVHEAVAPPSGKAGALFGVLSRHAVMLSVAICKCKPVLRYPRGPISPWEETCRHASPAELLQGAFRTSQHIANASTGDSPSVATSTAAQRQASSASAVANGSAHDASAAARSSADAISSCELGFSVVRDYKPGLYIGKLQRESYVGHLSAGKLQHKS